MAFARALIVIITIGNVAFADSTPQAFADVRELIEQTIARGRVPSLAVSVIQDGRIVWAEGFGSAQLDTETLATADTPYILASVSKPITATGLMVLVDRGKISLDQPVNEYLPGSKLHTYVGDANSVTIRRLANHTSGMPTHWNFFYTPNTPPSMDESIARFAFTAWTPGTRTNYSNLAFGILNYVTEVVSEKPWGTFMESEVFDPAGMMHTAYGIRPGLEGIAAHSYSQDSSGRWLRVTPYEFDHPGASAIWSSANDLARFLLLHMNHGEIDGTRILSTSAAEEMQRVHPDALAAGAQYGVSWAIGTRKGVKQIAHDGGMPGVRTEVAAYPELNAGYVVLTNGDGQNEIGRVASNLRKILLPEIPTPDKTPKSTKSKQDEPIVPRGAWSGHVVDGAKHIPIEIKFSDENVAETRIGGDGRLLRKSEARHNNGRTVFAMPGRFGAYAHFHGETELQFDLGVDSDALRGALYVTAPGYFRLPYYVELSKKND